MRFRPAPMEKLVYVLWRGTATPGAFAQTLRGELAAELARRSDGPLSLLLADGHALALERAAIRRSDPPVAGLVACWLDSLDDRRRVEEVLAPASARLAGYLVTESVPIRNRTLRASAPGERTPGVTMLSLLDRPERLAPEEWLRLWHEEHTPLAVEIQSTYHYVRNVVVRPLHEDAPPWAGIVEEGFPQEAVTDPMLWYDAGGSRELLRERMGRMLASVRRFLDIERVESLPMSEYVLREWPALERSAILGP